MNEDDNGENHHSRVSAYEVLTDAANPPGGDFGGYVPISAIVLISALDPESGREHLLHRCDNDSPPWKHMGMLQMVADDMRTRPLVDDISATVLGDDE